MKELTEELDQLSEAARQDHTKCEESKEQLALGLGKLIPSQAA